MYFLNSHSREFETRLKDGLATFGVVEKLENDNCQGLFFLTFLKILKGLFEIIFRFPLAIKLSDYLYISDKKSRGRRIDSGQIENCNECNRFCFPSAVRFTNNVLRHVLFLEIWPFYVIFFFQDHG